jgi:hypothetical protein
MGLDISIYREEILSSGRGKDDFYESVISRKDVYNAKGWELGEFLMDTFEIEIGVPRPIFDHVEVIAEVKKELVQPNYQPSVQETNQAWHDGYVLDLKLLIDALTAISETETGLHSYWWNLR